jgi:hypothetical protein
MMRQDVEYDYLHFSEMMNGVIYKVYLGYNDQTLDLFSSLCQLEETEMITG